MTNETIADHLRRHATTLARGGDNVYRVRAFRQAAMAVLALPEPAADLLARGGEAEFSAVAGVGRSVAATVATLVRTGAWPAAAPRRRVREFA